MHNSPSESPPSQHFLGRLAIIGTLAFSPACGATNHRAGLDSPSPSPSTSTVHPPTPSDKESAESDDIRRELVLNGNMDPKEVNLMQTMHEEIYEQYANPAFIQALKQSGNSDKVYPYLDLLMKDPDNFEYLDKGNHTVEIVKRRPYTATRQHIPDGFRIVIDGSNREVTRVNDVNLKMPDGSIPWMSNREYNGRMASYRARLKNEYVRLRNSGWESKTADLPANEPERSQKWLELITEPYQRVDADLQELYVLENIEFPKRFAGLVRARNLGFELKDPRFVDFMGHQERQGKTYEEITRQKRDKLQIVVSDDPQNPGVYQIHTRSMMTTPLRVNEKGYILMEGEDGTWVPDSRYHKALRRRYYERHPQAPKEIK